MLDALHVRMMRTVTLIEIDQCRWVAGWRGWKPPWQHDMALLLSAMTYVCMSQLRTHLTGSASHFVTKCLMYNMDRHVLTMLLAHLNILSFIFVFSKFDMDRLKAKFHKSFIFVFRLQDFCSHLIEMFYFLTLFQLIKRFYFCPCRLKFLFSFKKIPFYSRPPGSSACFAATWVRCTSSAGRQTAGWSCPAALTPPSKVTNKHLNALFISKERKVLFPSYKPANNNNRRVELSKKRRP